MPSPICRQQQLQSGFGVARTVGLFAHCPSSKAKGDVNGNQTGARKSAACRRRAGLGATRAAEASRGRLPFPRIFLSQSSSVPQDTFGTALPFPRIISRTALPFPRIISRSALPFPSIISRSALPFPRINSRSALPFPRIIFAQCTSVPQDISRSALPFPSKLGGGFAALLLP